MSETAASQLSRLVQLVAELSREPDVLEHGGLPIAEVARRLGATPAQVQRDIRTLTAASDAPDADWLQSLSVWQEGDRVAVSSLGPFRRPVRLTPEELLAIQVGLAMEDEAEGGALSRELTALLEGVPAAPVAADAGLSHDEASVVRLAAQAAGGRRLLTLLYAGERDFAGSPRTVEVHQVVHAQGAWYIVAWCRRASGWRHFRADRVLDAAIENAPFSPRPDHVPLTATGDVFRTGDDPVVRAQVRFSKGVARWLLESHPDANVAPDGSTTVRFEVADPRWLIRLILYYGADAELIEPAGWRALVRKAAEGGSRR